MLRVSICSAAHGSQHVVARDQRVPGGAHKAEQAGGTKRKHETRNTKHGRTHGRKSQHVAEKDQRVPGTGTRPDKPVVRGAHPTDGRTGRTGGRVKGEEVCKHTTNVVAVVGLLWFDSRRRVVVLMLHVGWCRVVSLAFFFFFTLTTRSGRLPPLLTARCRKLHRSPVHREFPLSVSAARRFVRFLTFALPPDKKKNTHTHAHTVHANSSTQFGHARPSRSPCICSRLLLVVLSHWKTVPEQAYACRTLPSPKGRSPAAASVAFRLPIGTACRQDANFGLVAVGDGRMTGDMAHHTVHCVVCTLYWPAIKKPEFRLSLSFFFVRPWPS